MTDSTSKERSFNWSSLKQAAKRIENLAVCKILNGKYCMQKSHKKFCKINYNLHKHKWQNVDVSLFGTPRPQIGWRNESCKGKTMHMLPVVWVKLVLVRLGSARLQFVTFC